MDHLSGGAGNDLYVLTGKATVIEQPGAGIDTVSADGSFSLATGTGAGDPFITAQFKGQAALQTIGFNFGLPNGFDGLTTLGGGSSASATNQDCFGSGGLVIVPGPER